MRKILSLHISWSYKVLHKQVESFLSLSTNVLFSCEEKWREEEKNLKKLWNENREEVELLINYSNRKVY